MGCCSWNPPCYLDGAAGYGTPPYHPLCRGILVPTGSVTDTIEPLQLSLPLALDATQQALAPSAVSEDDALEEEATTLTQDDPLTPEGWLNAAKW